MPVLQMVWREAEGKKGCVIDTVSSAIFAGGCKGNREKGSSPQLGCRFLNSAQPCPTKLGRNDAPFLNCTSEVTQWFLDIHVLLLHKITSLESRV